MEETKSIDTAKHGGSVDSRIGTPRSESLSYTLLEAYEPGNWDVICCGGKEGAAHAGNKQYKLCIANNIAAYQNAKSRQEKSMIVNAIVQSVENGDGSNSGGFVKKDVKTGHWLRVGIKAAREKVSHALRDAIKVHNNKEARMKRGAGRVRARELPSPKRKDCKTSGASRQSPWSHLHELRESDSMGALISDNENDEAFFSVVEIGQCDSANDEWEKSLQASTECFLKAEESEICFDT